LLNQAKRDLILYTQCQKKTQITVKVLAATESSGRKNEEKMSRTIPRKTHKKKWQPQGRKPQRKYGGLYGSLTPYNST